MGQQFIDAANEAEWRRLQLAVVSAAQKWRDGDEYVLNRETKSLIAVVEQLNAFEAQHNLNSKV